MNTTRDAAACCGDRADAEAKGLVLRALEAAGADRKPTDWERRLEAFSEDDVLRELAVRPVFSPKRLLALASPAAGRLLEKMAVAARALTRRRFGDAVTLFAPLYLSNYCVNGCRYCGFSVGRNRRRLSLGEAMEEARTIAGGGVRDILLVSGEDRAHIDVEYLSRLARELRRDNLFASVSIEVHIQTEDDYRRLFEAGIDGVTVFQETYDRDSYRFWHGGGPKAVYEDRINGQEAAARAGMRRLGLGALLGLEDWRFDAFAMAIHADALARNYWRARVSFSFPRIRPVEDGDGPEFRHLVGDAGLAQMLMALRLCFPDAGMTLSTRERPGFRENLVPLGITQISAGSRTDPGGYAGKDGGRATEQFAVSDGRGPREMADALGRMGFDPVWKDWDAGFCG